jgi:hypothetical protein
MSWGCAREAAALLVSGWSGGAGPPTVHPSPVEPG